MPLIFVCAFLLKNMPFWSHSASLFTTIQNQFAMRLVPVLQYIPRNSCSSVEFVSKFLLHVRWTGKDRIVQSVNLVAALLSHNINVYFLDIFNKRIIRNTQHKLIWWHDLPAVQFYDAFVKWLGKMSFTQVIVQTDVIENIYIPYFLELIINLFFPVVTHVLFRFNLTRGRILVLQVSQSHKNNVDEYLSEIDMQSTCCHVTKEWELVKAELSTGAFNRNKKGRN
jgi:hypothetical protein